MAEQLMKYYQFVGDQAGLSGKVKLAQLTRVPSAKAALEPENPEVIARFRAAIKEITGKDAPAY